MIKIEITHKNSRRVKAESRKREYALKVMENFKRELEANPELIGTVYQNEGDVAFELAFRVEEMVAIEEQADEMRGGWLGELKYKLAKK